ncbi:uncharacterized protein BDZ99DRAFT_513769 [Mytilinidion resinicola]|uniref:Cell wall anchor protein n=1 Tax=Mytilinidion resinicola TaxID=574789 RepID=A0A6A6ZA08_9PEZI|nr:uncharacterized protein BDZ99DRAFT_513769 [Mytilinidion resinicola]KAF2817529.1 hypothetical protein BDZ99DRAFT_513769 [Mytilinidion resinicola]
MNAQHASPVASMHNRTKTEPAAVSRIPSTTSSAEHGRRRRLTSPASPNIAPHSPGGTGATSYFSPQPSASGGDARSPFSNRRAPASRSAGGHGIDTSQGPPIALITRGSYSADIARRSQKASDFAFAQQQLQQLGLVAPGASALLKPGSATSSVASRGRRDLSPGLSRSGSTHSDSRRFDHMASSPDDSSDYDAGLRSPLGDTLTLQNTRRADAGSGTDGEPAEDLFLNIAQDTTPQKEDGDGGTTRTERRRSRIARATKGQSLPTNAYSSPAQPSASTTPKTSSAIDTKQAAHPRRLSQLPSPSITVRNMREQSPVSPANVLDNHRTRMLGLSPQASFSSSRSKEQEASPQLLPQYGRRRPSFPDASGTPPNRAYRPSNLHYSSSRDNDSTPHIDTPPEPNRAFSGADGTESADSIGAPSSVWDELDELKSRIRRIELSGKMPATSGAAISNGSGERPRTATTTVTTISSSPKHHRKPSTSPSESTVGGHTSSNIHPLLHSALAKAKENVSPSIYRGLEATVTEALALAALTGSAGPQGTLYSASSIINGATVPDRQVRRKADSLCRSLTELCIALCEVKINHESSAFRPTPLGTRRASVQPSSEVHTPTYSTPQPVRASIEPEAGVLRSSPSRALSRIEARRSSLMGLNGSRESSLEPPSQQNFPNRLSRAGTSLLRQRPMKEDDEDDPTLRAPSRAMTDFSQVRASNRSKRLSKDFSELQPSPSLQPTSSLRRPGGNAPSENHHTLASSTLLRDGNRRYRDHQTPPAYEKSIAGDSVGSEDNRRVQPALGHYVEAARAARASAGVGGLGRNGTFNRRVRGNGVGD